MVSILSMRGVATLFTSAPGDGETDPFFGELLGSLLGGAIDEGTISRLISPVLSQLIADALGTIWLTIITPLIVGFALIGGLLLVVIALQIVQLAKTNRIQKSLAAIDFTDPGETPALANSLKRPQVDE